MDKFQAGFELADWEWRPQKNECQWPNPKARFEYTAGAHWPMGNSLQLQ